MDHRVGARLRHAPAFDGSHLEARAIDEDLAAKKDLHKAAVLDYPPPEINLETATGLHARGVQHVRVVDLDAVDARNPRRGQYLDEAKTGV